MIATMAKEKKDSPAPTTKSERQTIQMPADWHRALLRLAGRWKQQKVWALCRLIGEAMDAEGLEHPPYPWELMEGDDPK